MQRALPLNAIERDFYDLGEAAGYVGAVTDTKTNTVTIYWHGPAIAAHLPIFARAKALGINLRVVGAPFSAAEIAKARYALLPLIKNPQVGFVEYNIDGSGFTLHFRNAAAIEAARASLAAAVSEAKILGTAPNSPLYSAPGQPQISLSDDAMNPVPSHFLAFPASWSERGPTRLRRPRGRKAH